MTINLKEPGTSYKKRLDEVETGECFIYLDMICIMCDNDNFVCLSPVENLKKVNFISGETVCEYNEEHVAQMVECELTYRLK